jgi:hypothetical protein
VIKKKITATYMVPVQVDVSFELEARTEDEMNAKIVALGEKNVRLPVGLKNLKFDADMNTQKDDITLSFEQGQEVYLSTHEVEDAS